METGIFYDPHDADEAVRLLHELGYRDDEISVMMNDRTRATELLQETGTRLPEGAGAGVMIGGTLGGLIAAAAAATGVAASVLTIGAAAPLVIGPLTTILAGMGAGGVVGGIVGALVGAGIPEERAREIDTCLQRGGVMIGVTPSPENRRRVNEILAPADHRRAVTGELEPTEFTPDDIPPRRTIS
jgi:hypothetical protein